MATMRELIEQGFEKELLSFANNQGAAEVNHGLHPRGWPWASWIDVPTEKKIELAKYFKCDDPESVD